MHLHRALPISLLLFFIILAGCGSTKKAAAPPTPTPLPVATYCLLGFHQTMVITNLLTSKQATVAQNFGQKCFPDSAIFGSFSLPLTLNGAPATMTGEQIQGLEPLVGSATIVSTVQNCTSSDQNPQRFAFTAQFTPGLLVGSTLYTSAPTNKTVGQFDPIAAQLYKYFSLDVEGQQLLASLAFPLSAPPHTTVEETFYWKEYFNGGFIDIVENGSQVITKLPFAFPNQVSVDDSHVHLAYYSC